MKKWIIGLLILFLHISPVQAQEISTSLTVMHNEEDTCQYTLSGNVSRSFAITGKKSYTLPFTFTHAGSYTYTLTSSQGLSYKIVILVTNHSGIQRFVYNDQGEKSDRLTFPKETVKTDNQTSYQAPHNEEAGKQMKTEKTDQTPGIQKEESSSKQKKPAYQTKKNKTDKPTSTKETLPTFMQKGIATGDTTHIAFDLMLLILSFGILICLRRSH